MHLYTGFREESDMCLTSELDAIPGVGKKTVQKLLKHFGSSELVRAATE